MYTSMPITSMSPFNVTVIFYYIYGIPINITDWNGYEEMVEENINTIKESVYHRVGDTVWNLSRIVFNEGELVISSY